MAPQPQNKLGLSLSVDAFVAIIFAIFMQVVHVNVPTLIVLWIAIICAVANFIWVVPFAKTPRAARALIILVVCGYLAYTAYDSVHEKLNADALREETEGARVEIVNVGFVDVGKSPDATFPFFNFYYKNDGHLTAQGVRRRFGAFSNNQPIEEKEIDDLFRRLEDDPYVFSKADQIPPGNEGNFSEPHDYDAEQKAVEKIIPDVKEGKTLLYLLEVTKYRDQLMARDKVRVSEHCVFFGKELNVAYFCRQNNVRMADVK